MTIISTELVDVTFPLRIEKLRYLPRTTFRLLLPLLETSTITNLTNFHLNKYKTRVLTFALLWVINNHVILPLLPCIPNYTDLHTYLIPIAVLEVLTLVTIKVEHDFLLPHVKFSRS